MTNYPSKVVATFGMLNWGMCDFNIASPYSFSAVSNGKSVSFTCSAQNHDNPTILIPMLDPNTQFTCFVILNKKGDNLIVVDNKDIESSQGKSVSFEWIADKIKRKYRVEIKQLE